MTKPLDHANFVLNGFHGSGRGSVDRHRLHCHQFEGVLNMYEFVFMPVRKSEIEKCKDTMSKIYHYANQGYYSLKIRAII
jgi:hypothetical protein